MTYEIIITDASGGTKTHRVEVLRSVENVVSYRVDGKAFDGDIASPVAGVLSILLAGNSYEAVRDLHAGQSSVVVAGQRFEVEVSDPRSLQARKVKAGASDGPKKITAPMPGKVVRIIVPEGGSVEAGQGVIVIEAMKMQNELKSPKKGVVRKLLSAEGDTVTAGQALAVIE
ncbi:MAG TPA: biotin/lipoyl-containing protein [Terriglobales bacterium]|nr:biotin/lipoyl-containing protein [Terriglobales bacterium]